MVVVQLLLQFVHKSCLDVARDRLVILSHERSGGLCGVAYHLRIVAGGDAQVRHQGKHVVIQRPEVQDKVVIDGARVAELQERGKVLVVRAERELGHELQKVRESRVNVHAEVPLGYPALQPFCIVKAQNVGLETVGEPLSERGVERLLQLVPVRAEQPLHGIAHHRKPEVVLQLVQCLLSRQVTERVNLKQRKTNKQTNKQTTRLNGYINGWLDNTVQWNLSITDSTIPNHSVNQTPKHSMNMITEP